MSVFNKVFKVYHDSDRPFELAECYFYLQQSNYQFPLRVSTHDSKYQICVFFYAAADTHSSCAGFCNYQSVSRLNRQSILCLGLGAFCVDIVRYMPWYRLPHAFIYVHICVYIIWLCGLNLTHVEHYIVYLFWESRMLPTYPSPTIRPSNTLCPTVSV
jgi:hypothetical protein